MSGEHTLAEPKLKVTLRCTPTPPNQCTYQVSTFYALWNQRNKPRQDFKTHGHYDKVKVQIKVTS